MMTLKYINLEGYKIHHSAYVEDAYRMYRDYMVYLFDDDRVYLGND